MVSEKQKRERSPSAQGAKGASSPLTSRRESGVHRPLRRPEWWPGHKTYGCQVSVITVPGLSRKNLNSRSACLCHVQASEGSTPGRSLGEGGLGAGGEGETGLFVQAPPAI